MTSTHIDSDVTRLQIMPGTLKSDWDLNSTDAKTIKIELEIIMSDVAIRYLGALTFFVNLKNFMVTICRASTFQLSTHLKINNCCFVFIFAFAPFEISPKYAFIRQILHVPGW